MDKINLTQQELPFLPIFRFKHELLEIIQANQVSIFVGTNDSGRSTQTPQFILEAGLNGNKKIACAQTRRMNAKCIAEKVAGECGCVVGQEVGYRIRFEDVTTVKTKIEYMTDGVLLRECLCDGELNQYSVIILDDVNERTVHTDVLVGLLKMLIEKRKDLKLVIITSASESEKICDFFHGAAIFRMPTERILTEEMKIHGVPEIQRTNLSNIVLFLKAMGIADLSTFQFIDAPKTEMLQSAIIELKSLQALDNEDNLTKLGQQMAKFPLDVKLGNTLIMSSKLGCSEEVVTIVAILNAGELFDQCGEGVNEKRKQFEDARGDHLTLLSLYNGWVSNACSVDWCRDNCICNRSMIVARDIRQQLVNVMARNKLEMKSCGANVHLVQRAISSGLINNRAKRVGPNIYQTLCDNKIVHLHPSSVLFGNQPNMVVFNELQMTDEVYMSIVSTFCPDSFEFQQQVGF